MGVTSVDGPDRAVQARAYAAPAPPIRTAEAAPQAQKLTGKPNEEQVQPANLPAKVKEAGAAPIPASTTRIRVDKESNRIVTQIIGENNEVIRQLPPQELLDFSARFKKLQGLLFDQRA